MLEDGVDSELLEVSISSALPRCSATALCRIVLGSALGARQPKLEPKVERSSMGIGRILGASRRGPGGGPEGSRGGPGGVPEGPAGVPGGSRGSPEGILWGPGGSKEAPGAILGVLGESRGRLGLVRGGVLGRSWGGPGGSWGSLGGLPGGPGSVPGESWGVLGPSWANSCGIHKNLQKPKENALFLGSRARPGEVPAASRSLWAAS